MYFYLFIVIRINIEELRSIKKWKLFSQKYSNVIIGC